MRALLLRSVSHINIFGRTHDQSQRRCFRPSHPRQAWRGEGVVRLQRRRSAARKLPPWTLPVYSVVNPVAIPGKQALALPCVWVSLSCYQVRCFERFGQQGQHLCLGNTAEGVFFLILYEQKHLSGRHLSERGSACIICTNECHFQPVPIEPGNPCHWSLRHKYTRRINNTEKMKMTQITHFDYGFFRCAVV